jgi:muconolactone delta-isomerase
MSLMSFMLKMVVTVMVPVLAFANYLKRSRDTESVKRLQQGGKRGKFWESFGEWGKIAGLLPGWLSFLDLRPSVFE